MAQPLNPNIVQYLLNSHEFAQYIQWVNELMGDLDSVGGLDGMKNYEAGEEVRVRAKAIQILNMMLSPFIEYRSKREITVDEFQRAKSTYGL